MFAGQLLVDGVLIWGTLWVLAELLVTISPWAFSVELPVANSLWPFPGLSPVCLSLSGANFSSALLEVGKGNVGKENFG